MNTETYLNTQVARVAVFSPLRRCFDYICPENLTYMPGMRVEIPFGHKTRIGILTEIAQTSELPRDKLKPLLRVLDECPLFSESMMQLILWASQYYHHPIGEVFEAAIPSFLRKGKGQVGILPTDALTAALNDPKTVSSSNLLFNLNADQQKVLDVLFAAIAQEKFQAFLLEGVTGSGKTEVYMGVIEAVLQQGKQALILVPEIGLTPQMLQRLEARFAVPIAVLHSGLTEKQRFLAWEKARLGEAPIVLGTRSAVFTPLLKPGVFILDEEHDASFKQQDSFRYSARDLLIMRASLENCPVILGSATPSLETLYNAEKQRYTKLSLPNRVNTTLPPNITVLDIRHKKLKEGLSHALIKKMQDHLEDGGQVLVFLNRRGFAPVLMCFDCGNTAQCKHCDARLTVHYQKSVLKCHHCEFTQPLYAACPSCQSHNISPVGFGTERLEAALTEIFPEYQIQRIDRDTTRKKDALKEAMAKIQQGDVQILLGTQMLAKGHHFPNLSLVAILDIDNALFSVDFRGMERLGQLLTQVAGRAGRAERLGEVLLQTCHPTHPLLQQLLQAGYGVFAETLLMERRVSHLPPFSYQALLRVEAKNANTGLQFLNKIKTHFNTVGKETLQILGPVSAPMERRGGKYHAQLLLQSNHRKALRQVLSEISEMVALLPEARSLRWSLDVDPIEMF